MVPKQGIMGQTGKQKGSLSRGYSQQGQEGEELAVRHLKRRGYRIICQNYRSPLGEIDIVAHHRGVLVFVEVKSRRSETFGSPKLAVTPAKQRKLSQVAWHYLQQHNLTEASARFDVVTISGSTGAPYFEVIENAFESTY
ncbi:MAG: YraN family protein [Deltaproteobacteria bacterium]|nr:YraN family protein [Deltaproteobacteria bacterium]